MICFISIQLKTCMPAYTVRTADQLPALLQAFRKEAGLTQSEAALRLGVTQQTYSALERNAKTVGAARLLHLLGILGVELVLRKPAPSDATPPTDGSASKPAW
jgi:HTH-type transcriptional regulator / antitoxin HipB